MAARIKKADQVVVISGKDKGKTGEVIEVLPKLNRVKVRGVNLVKKHQKATKATMQGGIIDKEMPIHVSNVAIVDPKTGGPSRVGYRFDDKGNKVRISRKSGADL